MGCPDELLFFLGKVSREKLSTVRKHPGAPVRDLDAREDIRRILVELLLYGLADIRGDRSDVDKAGHAIIDARGRYCSASVGMAHEDDRAADAVEGALHRSNVLFERVEAILNCDYLMPIRLQCGDDLAKARAIGPNAVAEHDGWFALQRHRNLLGVKLGQHLVFAPLRIRCAQFVLVNKYFVC